MTLGRLVLASLVAALAVAALPAGSGAAKECNGVPRCISVAGPWVSVPPAGEVGFLLECPQGMGIVAGTDALVSSQDVRATFDGLLSSPVAPGRTTGSSAFFRAVSAHHRAGMFQPFIGCIPAPKTLRNTLAAAAPPAGPPPALRATLIKLQPGAVKTVSFSCRPGEVLVDSWVAKAFETATPPPPDVATAIQLQTRIRGRQVFLAITASEALPPSVNAVVQLGVRCANS